MVEVKRDRVFIYAWKVGGRCDLLKAPGILWPAETSTNTT